MSDLAAGGSDPESEAGGFTPAEAPGNRGGEPLGPGTCHTGVNIALCAGVPMVTEQGLVGGPGGDTIPDQHVQLEDPEDPTEDPRYSVLRGLFKVVDMLEDLGVRFMPEHNGGRRETDQHVQRLEDPEEHFGQRVHIDLPWDQGELTVTFTPLASRRGSSTDFGP